MSQKAIKTFYLFQVVTQSNLSENSALFLMQIFQFILSINCIYNIYCKPHVERTQNCACNVLDYQNRTTCCFIAALLYNIIASFIAFRFNNAVLHCFNGFLAVFHESRIFDCLSFRHVYRAMNLKNYKF